MAKIWNEPGWHKRGCIMFESWVSGRVVGHPKSSHKRRRKSKEGNGRPLHNNDLQLETSHHEKSTSRLQPARDQGPARVIRMGQLR